MDIMELVAGKLNRLHKGLIKAKCNPW